MDEITIGDKVYVSSKRAAKITGYAKDYVGQLCREGRVEARLVGRNWYVLESSIREHRFGEVASPVPAAKEEIPASPVSSWSAPRYEAVTAPQMPEFAPRKAAPTPAEPEEPVQESGSEEKLIQSLHTEQTVADMQAAWREWFENQPRAESAPVEEPEEIEESYTEEEETVSEPSYMSDEPETVPVSRMYTPIPEEIDEEEPEAEEVVLHRASTPRREEYRTPAQSSVIDLSARAAKAERPARREQPRKSHDESDHDGGIVLRAVFLSIAALAMIVAFIGSGYADSLFMHGNNGVQQDVVNYLQGASTVNK